MAENPHSGSGALPPIIPVPLQDTVYKEPEVPDSQSAHNTPTHSDNTVAINTQIQLAKIQLASEKECTKQAELKAYGWSISDPLLPAPKRPCYKKRVKDEDIYQLCLEESNRYLDYLLTDQWTAHRNEKSMEDTWDNQKAFLEMQLGDRDNQVYNAWMDWMNCHKLGNKSDNEYLHRSDELLAQIRNEAKDHHWIQLMIFFKGLDQAMKQKICGHPVFPNSHEDLITLAKKLQPSIGTEAHLQTTTINTGSSESTSANVAKWSPRKPSMSITTKLHKKLDCLKKKSDNTAGRTLPTILASGSNHVVAASGATAKVVAKPKLKKGAASTPETQL
ncbi:hypothetical protein LPUS_04695 [Lasallia pustulata]|uniref:Uncharacterized protein n=1 Tax=Lasallia pustulata TaxID=136370 RepID=A0A1W5CX24_9LECA|nr:hypothetical protein LPUS_04695 [Lasallia pustulata]